MEPTISPPRPTAILSSAIASVASKDIPTVTTEHGGRHSDLPARFDLIDANALFKMAVVLKEGAEKYGEELWRGIAVRDHLNHAIMHIFAYLGGDESDDHLSHAMCRIMFALAVSEQGGPIMQDGFIGKPFPSVEAQCKKCFSTKESQWWKCCPQHCTQDGDDVVCYDCMRKLHNPEQPTSRPAPDVSGRDI